jgi:hypothetical protein
VPAIALNASSSQPLILFYLFTGAGAHLTQLNTPDSSLARADELAGIALWRSCSLVAKPSEGFLFSSKITNVVDVIALREFEDLWIQSRAEDRRNGHHWAKLLDVPGAFFCGCPGQIHQQLATVIIQETG